MSTFAKVLDGRVINIIVADADFIATFHDPEPGQWIETDFYTRENVHYNEDGTPSGNPPMRGNYATIGGTYDAEADAFYSQCMYPSWTLNRTTWSWEPPVPMPTYVKQYIWNEETKSWTVFGS